MAAKAWPDSRRVDQRQYWHRAGDCLWYQRYPFVAVMSKGNSMERARMMSALGAEVVLVDQLPDSKPGQVSGGDLELVEIEAQRIAKERHAFRADQFRLAGNFRAHYLHTGPEFIMQSGGAIDAFCDFVGTGGSFAGCAAAFKAHNPAIQCFVVEPDGAAVLAKEPVTYPNHRIQGGGYSMPILPQLRSEHIDGYLKVTDRKPLTLHAGWRVKKGFLPDFHPEPMWPQRYIYCRHPSEVRPLRLFSAIQA
jgi:cysteine synthase